jgi:hypothetical protein
VVKRLILLTLLSLLIIAIASGTFVKAYSPQYNAQDTVASIKDAVTFTTQTGYTLRLANLEALKPNNIAVLTSKIPPNTPIYFDILNQSIVNGSLTFTSVVYINYNDTHYENLNRFLLNQTNNYAFAIDSNNIAITPYTWDYFLPKQTVTNNTVGLDLSSFENDRLALLNSYDSQTLTHAGFLVTVSLAFAALLITIPSSKDDNLEKIFGKYKNWIILVSFLFLTTLLLYISYRMFFWSWMSSEVMVVTPQEAIAQGKDTLTAGMHWYLTNYFSTIPKHFGSVLYLLDQKVTFFFSAFVLLPVTGALSLGLTKLVTKFEGFKKTRINILFIVAFGLSLLLLLLDFWLIFILDSVCIIWIFLNVKKITKVEAKEKIVFL